MQLPVKLARLYHSEDYRLTVAGMPNTLILLDSFYADSCNELSSEKTMLKGFNVDK